MSCCRELLAHWFGTGHRGLGCIYMLQLVPRFVPWAGCPLCNQLQVVSTASACARLRMFHLLVGALRLRVFLPFHMGVHGHSVHTDCQRGVPWSDRKCDDMSSMPLVLPRVPRVQPSAPILIWRLGLNPKRRPDLAGPTLPTTAARISLPRESCVPQFQDCLSSITTRPFSAFKTLAIVRASWQS